MKNSLEGLNSWFELAEATNELEDGLTEDHAIQKKNRIKNEEKWTESQRMALLGHQHRCNGSTRRTEERQKSRKKNGIK